MMTQLIIGVFSIGTIFLGLSIFDKSTPKGGVEGPMYRARGGLISILILILWILLGSYFLSLQGPINLNPELIVIILIGIVIGYLLWKSFIHYNRNI